MSGTNSASIVGVSRWISPSALDLVGQRQLEPVEDVERLLPHHHDDPRLHDRDLLGDPLDAGVGGVGRDRSAGT